MGVIVTFLGIMELVREALIEFVQTEAFGPIHVRAVQGAKESAPVFVTNYGGETNDADEHDDGEDGENA